ncbi:hypothetical protein DFH08DRAFT_903671 [Mycena albidolilacea]|uniref:Uncharacterized protein n=1 Tax=Mycena albidolilacea TaxID=1033008 RepID=A0AAD7E965_9AGAR|nr:hypothetical protein DFH08DRAFT_903671 [Mycena albidolilacea]
MTLNTLHALAMLSPRQAGLHPPASPLKPLTFVYPSERGDYHCLSRLLLIDNLTLGCACPVRTMISSRITLAGCSRSLPAPPRLVQPSGRCDCHGQLFTPISDLQERMQPKPCPNLSRDSDAPSRAGTVRNQCQHYSVSHGIDRRVLSTLY